MSELIRETGPARQFGTGAQRDNVAGKGRMDLLPFDVLLDLMPERDSIDNVAAIVTELMQYPKTREDKYLDQAIYGCMEMLENDAIAVVPTDADCLDWTPLAFMEIARIFEAGAKKYNERNWERGIPTSVYLDSALRHLCKHAASYTDEPHLAMAAWNLLCLKQTIIWTKDGTLDSKVDNLPGGDGWAEPDPGMRPADDGIALSPSTPTDLSGNESGPEAPAVVDPFASMPAMGGPFPGLAEEPVKSAVCKAIQIARQKPAPF